MVARTAPTSVTLRRRLLLVVIAFGVVTLLGSGSTWAENTPTPVIANAQPDLHDAPHLFHQDDGSLIARWVVAGVVREKRFAGGEPVALPQFASLMGERLVPRRHSPGPAIWDQPEKIVAISDVEGQYDILRNFLRGNQIIDANGNWSFGKGHLV